MYDWANSAFSTSGTAAIFPVYFVVIFKAAMGDNTDFFGFSMTGSSIWSLGVALSTAIVAVSSPVLGVIADRAAIKKTLLWIYTIAGSAFTVLAFFSVYTSQPWIWLALSFGLANIGFSGSLVFYNSILPHIAPKHLLDDVSSRGFAYGYIGAGLLLAIHLAAIFVFSGTELEDFITRLCIATVGFWWFGFAIWTLKTVPEPPIFNPVPGLNISSALRLAIKELGKTLRGITKFKTLLIYLVAYLLFNDGIQTVLAIAGAYGADTLGITLIFNMMTILIIQFIAAPGAMLFSRLASWVRTKPALIVGMIGWCVVVLFGVGIAPLVPSSQNEFDYQFKFDQPTNSYLVIAAPNLSGSEPDTMWEQNHGDLQEAGSISVNQTRILFTEIRESATARFSVSIVEGPLAGQTSVGAKHVSSMGEGPLDWWPLTLRTVFWEPLGLSSSFQWLILGALLGVVMGGSQALSRSLFAQIMPETRSGEFFSFFGFMSRASTVIGPTLYILFTGLFDTRVAISSLLVIIVVGTVMLRWVDVDAGSRLADLEDQRNRA
ncbi:MAG: MFS-type transporter involved in bile tolerance [Chloroflexi bacterium]|jgi:UMF1 family MFS transporter|nr:MAG: MFS-type transporter involved in bile tolerance [Chloroflexota bacterium]